MVSIVYGSRSFGSLKTPAAEWVSGHAQRGPKPVLHHCANVPCSFGSGVEVKVALAQWV
jgi:hypothetical protein